MMPAVPADGGMDGRRPSLYERIRREQVKALAAAFPSAALGNLANLAVALVAVHGVLPAGTAAAWGATLVLTLLVRIPIHRRSREPAGDPERLLRLQALGALSTGTAWGALFALLPPMSGFPAGHWLAFQVAGLSAGGALLDAADRRVAAAYALPLLAGFALHLALVEGSLGARLLAGLVVIYAGLLLVTGRAFERRFVRLARLSAERSRLLVETLERRRREEARRAGLEAECARLRAMLDGLPLPLALFSPDGTGPKVANAAFHALLGAGGALFFARASALARRAAAEGTARDAPGQPALQARRLPEGVLVWAAAEASAEADGSDRHVPATGPPAPHSRMPGT